MVPPSRPSSPLPTTLTNPQSPSYIGGIKISNYHIPSFPQPPFDPYASTPLSTDPPQRIMSLIGKGSFLLRRALGIPQDEESHHPTRVTRCNWIAQSYQAQPFVDHDPGVAEWVKDHIPTGGQAWELAKSFFPFTSWVMRYNKTWLAGDLVAGVTVAAVVVPQGMAYAKLAQLPVEYGLYSSFMGVVIYWIFATSRDITIGPVAVMSQLVGDIVINAKLTHPQFAGHVIASALAVICGCIIFAIGLFRLGFIVDFIPLPAIAAFMTGSAVNIISGQVPTLLGISSRLNTRASTYLVIIHTLQNMHASTLDAAMGLTSLALLYGLRALFAYLGQCDRSRSRLWFFLSTLRTVFVILLYTMVSWLVNRHRRSSPAFSILLTVPRGFQHAAVPTINTDIISSFSSELPSAVIVLLIEHIAISKSFGRINGYNINPSQELIAIGATNIFGPFLGAYPATGSFSRTAIKSKAGVKTPFAGVITGIVVLLALYALTAVFYYIPSASLAAVIIHAVGDLIVAPNVVYGFWKVSPLEVLIFFAGVIVTVFSTIEIGIYTTIASSATLLLFRIAKANGQFLGRVKVRSIEGSQTRYIYLPLDRSVDGTNPSVALEQPYPGIFVYRFTDSFLYPNANHYTDQMVQHIMRNTKRHGDAKVVAPEDRPWNDPAPRNWSPEDTAAVARADPRPTLRAVICDFSGVNNVDVTSVQVLVDVRNQLDAHAAPLRVEWHFANMRNAWINRALASVGFGKADNEVKPIFVVSDIAAGQPSGREGEHVDDEESKKFTGVFPVSSLDRPWFHVDIDSAVRSALTNIGVFQKEAGGISSRPASILTRSEWKSEGGREL